MSMRCVGRYALAVVLWSVLLSPLRATPLITEPVIETPVVSKTLGMGIWAAPSAEALWLANLSSIGEFRGWPSQVRPRPQADAQPYGYVSSARLKGGLQDKWQAVKSRLPAERKILATCREDMTACPDAARRLLSLIDSAMQRDRTMRVAEINRAINLTIRFAEDRDTYGVEEMWATPLMTFEQRAGDCEDYAIAKFVALQEMRFDTHDLRLVIVRDDKGQGHAMAAARQDGRWLILDNRHLGVQSDTVTAQSKPVFLIDEDGAKRLTASKEKELQPAPVAAAPVMTAPVMADLPAWPTTQVAPISVL